MIQPSYRYRARLERAVDGDTVYLNVDLGFRASMSLNVRLAGVNAPELHDAGGREALVWLRDKIANHSLVLVSAKGDKYGRWLGLIYVEDEEVSVNAQMVEFGHAVIYDGGPRA